MRDGQVAAQRVIGAGDNGDRIKPLSPIRTASYICRGIRRG
jgi:hypothetical protein